MRKTFKPVDERERLIDNPIEQLNRTGYGINYPPPMSSLFGNMLPTAAKPRYHHEQMMLTNNMMVKQDPKNLLYPPAAGQHNGKNHGMLLNMNFVNSKMETSLHHKTMASPPGSYAPPNATMSSAIASPSLTSGTHTHANENLLNLQQEQQQQHTTNNNLNNSNHHNNSSLMLGIGNNESHPFGRHNFNVNGCSYPGNDDTNKLLHQHHENNYLMNNGSQHNNTNNNQLHHLNVDHFGGCGVNKNATMNLNCTSTNAIGSNSSLKSSRIIDFVNNNNNNNNNHSASRKNANEYNLNDKSVKSDNPMLMADLSASAKTNAGVAANHSHHHSSGKHSKCATETSNEFLPQTSLHQRRNHITFDDDKSRQSSTNNDGDNDTIAAAADDDDERLTNADGDDDQDEFMNL